MNKGAQKKAVFIAGLRMQLLTTAPQHTAGLGGEIRLNPGNPSQFCTLDVDRSTLFEFQKVKTQGILLESDLPNCLKRTDVLFVIHQVSTTTSNRVPNRSGFRVPSYNINLKETNIFVNLSLFFF